MIYQLVMSKLHKSNLLKLHQKSIIYFNLLELRREWFVTFGYAKMASE